MITFIKDLFQPSQGITSAAYGRAVIAIGHATLGAAAALAASYAGMWLLYVLLVGYLAKEALDVCRGGKVADSSEDTMSVLIGAIGYASSPAMLPLALMAVGGIVGFVASLKNGRSPKNTI